MSYRLRLEAQGRSLLLFNGLRIKGRWWKEPQWNEVRGSTLDRAAGTLERSARAAPGSADATGGRHGAAGKRCSPSTMGCGRVDQPGPGTRDPELGSI